MSKLTLFNTPYASAKDLAMMITPAATFLIKNYPLVVLTSDQINELSNTRLYSSTPISKLFQDIVTADKLPEFLYVNLTRFKTDIPQILALDDIVVDGANTPITSMPAQLQKCWINITPYVANKDSYNGQLNVTDTSAFANETVRAALVQSYNDTDMWLNPRLAVILIECYASVISHTTRQAFNLNFEEEKFVQTLFATYYAQLLGPANGSLKLPPLLLRCTFLGSAADISGRLERIEPYRENNGEDLLTPYKICQILNQTGPARMHSFTPQQLYRFTSSSSVDSQTMLIAMDYPPYWAYQMLRCVSGFKNPLMSTVMKMNLKLKTAMTEFASLLQSTNAIIAKLNRG